jgi:acyl transferase domain-containing protein
VNVTCSCSRSTLTYSQLTAHVILESAEDYFALNGYMGHSRTTKSLISPTLAIDSFKNRKEPHTTNGIANVHSKTHRNVISAHPPSNGHLNGTTNGPTNGTTNGTTNGANGHSNGSREASEQYPARIFVLSTFDKVTGKKQADDLREYLQNRVDILHPELLRRLAFTLSERRTHHIWKAAVVARSARDLAQCVESDVLFSSNGTKKRKLGFVFTGQGAQWCGMGKELIARYPIFRATLERTSRCLENAGAPFNVIGKHICQRQFSFNADCYFSDEITKDPEHSDINRALYSQPICTAVQIALVDLLASFGVKPASVTGHSSGEIAASYTAGALSLEDAMHVAYFRGVASTNLAKKGIYKGSMMAVGLSKEETLPFLASLTRGKAVVACSNSPSSVTVSGDEEAIDELHSILDGEKIFARKLVGKISAADFFFLRVLSSRHILRRAYEVCFKLSSGLVLTQQ